MSILSLALSGILAAATPGYHPLDEIRVPRTVAGQPLKQQLTGQVIFANTIEKELVGFFEEPCKLVVMDNTFGCLPEADTRAMVQHLLFTFDATYIVEARDCDDLALEFIVKLRRFYREKCEDVPFAAPVGLVGVRLVDDIPEMGYWLGGRIGYHAIVVVRCAGGKWLLVDPATKRISEFTQHLYEGTADLILGIF